MNFFQAAGYHLTDLVRNSTTLRIRDKDRESLKESNGSKIVSKEVVSKLLGSMTDFPEHLLKWAELFCRATSVTL